MRSIPWFLALAASLAGCGPGGSSDTVGPAPDPAQAEARYRKARVVDLAQPLMLVPGAPMCPDLKQVEAYFTGQPHGCVSAKDPAGVAVVGDGSVVGEAVFEVRAPDPSGQGSGVFWLPKDGVTNNLAELKAAFDDLKAANGGLVTP